MTPLQRQTRLALYGPPQQFTLTAGKHYGRPVSSNRSTPMSSKFRVPVDRALRVGDDFVFDLEDAERLPDDDPAVMASARATQFNRESNAAKAAQKRCEREGAPEKFNDYYAEAIGVL